MAFSKNILVRVGADLSKLRSGFRQAGQTTQKFAQDTASSVRTAAAATAKVSPQVKSLTKQLEELKAKRMNWRELGFSDSDSNVRAVTAQIAELEAKLRTLRGQDPGAATTASAMDQIAREASTAASGLTRVSDASRRTSQAAIESAERVRQAWSNMQTISGPIRSAFSHIRDGAGIVGTAIRHPLQALDRLAGAAVSGGVKIAKALGSTAASGVRRLASGLKSIGSGVVGGIRSVASHIANIGHRARSSRSGVGGLMSSIKSIGIAAIGLRIAAGAFGRFRSIVRSTISENETLQAQCNSLKSALSQSLTPAIQVVMNALSAIMPYILGVSNAIGSLLANLFGKGWTSAAKGATAAAEATSGAAAAQKEYNRTLAGFDEITKLDSSSGGGGGGGGGGGASNDVTTETITGKLPSWLTDLASQIKDAISAGNWTGVGEILASKLGDAVDLARSKINDPAFRQKVSNIVSHVTDTINGFFGKLTETDDAGNSIAGNIGRLIGDGVGLALNSINQFLTQVNWANIGTAVAQGINGVLSSLSSNDVNFGTVLGNIINAGIQGAGGIVRNLNWSGLGSELARNVNNFFGTIDWAEAGRTLSDSLKGILNTITTGLREIDWAQIGTSIKDFISNVDWAGVAGGIAEALGTLAGGIASALWSALGDALTNTYEYFRQNIEDCGGNVIAGIGQGIINWLADVGTWMYNNIWTPFVNGFKSTFSIASPSTSPTIRGLGSDLIHGLFNGIVSWLANIGNWLKTNVWDKIVNGFRSLFANNPISVTPNFDVQPTEGGVGGGGSGGGPTFSSDGGLTVDIYGNVIDISDGRKEKKKPKFEVKGDVTSADTSKVPPKDKILHGGGIVAEKMSDRLSTAQKTFNTTSRFSWVSDNLSGSQKTVNTTSRYSWSTDNLSGSQRTVNTTSRFSWVSDALSAEARKIKSTAFMVAVVDALPASARRIQIAAQIVPGWRGSLASYLGIDRIKTTLVLQAPKVHINWDSFRWYNTKYAYPRSFYTTYYARGGILDAATLLGMDRTGAHIAGEAGREAVLPLENHTEWMDRIAEKTAALLGGANGRQVIENRIILDGREIARNTREVWRQEVRNGGAPLAGIA